MNAGHPKRVIIADALDAAASRVLLDQGFQVEDRAGIAPAALAEILPGAAGLLVRSRTKVTRELLAAADGLRAVGRAGSGVDNIDVAAANERGVLVLNAPGGNAIAAAEHALALLFALARHIAPAAASVRTGQWDAKPFMGFELTGKTLGIVGLGRIGRELARRAQGLQMHVLGCDPVLPKEVADDLRVPLHTLPELIARVDILSLHVPFAADTKSLVDAALLSRAKKGLVLINAARGGIVDETALLAALTDGTVRAAALDVLATEPPTDRRLIDHERVLVTPHLGASTREAQTAVGIAIAADLARFLQGGRPDSPVNPQILTTPA